MGWSDRKGCVIRIDGVSGVPPGRSAGMPTFTRQRNWRAIIVGPSGTFWTETGAI